MASYIDMIEQYEKEIIAKKERIDELEIVMQKILSETTNDKIKNWIIALFPAKDYGPTYSPASRQYNLLEEK